MSHSKTKGNRLLLLSVAVLAGQTAHQRLNAQADPSPGPSPSEISQASVTLQTAVGPDGRPYITVSEEGGEAKTVYSPDFEEDEDSGSGSTGNPCSASEGIQPACQQVWPAVSVSAEELLQVDPDSGIDQRQINCQSNNLDPGDATAMASQICGYREQQLHTFTGDVERGDVNGAGEESFGVTWSRLGPDGQRIDDESPASVPAPAPAPAPPAPPAPTTEPTSSPTEGPTSVPETTPGGGGANCIPDFRFDACGICDSCGNGTCCTGSTPGVPGGGHAPPGCTPGAIFDQCGICDSCGNGDCCHNSPPMMPHAP